MNAKREEYSWKGSGSTETAFQMVFHALIKENRTDLFALFLQKGALVNEPILQEAHTMRYDGSTCTYVLHIAVRKSNFEIVKLLLDHGAKVVTKMYEKRRVGIDGNLIRWIL